MVKYLNKKRLTVIILSVLLLMIIILVVLLPSFIDNELMFETQSGKTWLFLWIVIGMSILWLFKLIVKFPKRLYFCQIDLLLFIWTAYVLSNIFVRSLPISNRLIELCGTIMCYIILRQIQLKLYPLIMVAIVVGGIMQAIYGNLQLWGICSSHHGIFRLTGSFFNPGPYAGYLASVFPVALGLYLFKFDRFCYITKWKEKVLIKLRKINPGSSSISKFIAGVGLISILSVILASQSRAAWVAVIISSSLILSIHFSIFYWLKRQIRTPFRRIASVLLISAVISAGLFGLFYLKVDSSNGRLFIWEVSFNQIFVKHPLTGVGFDQFKTYYMDEQAAYFKTNPKSTKTMIAGDTQYVFNDFFQQAIENGLIGLFLVLMIFIALLRVRSIEQKSLLRTAQAGIISIAIFSIFSYPVQILPIKISLLFCVATVAGLASQKCIRLSQNASIVTKTILIVVVILIILTGMQYNKHYSYSWKIWKQAFILYEKNDIACLNKYEMAFPMLQGNGDFLMNYGKALSINHKHDQAVTILQQASKYYPSIVVYCALGDSYKALGRPVEAEEAYLHAWYMNPSRFYPQYLLVMLYDETGQCSKAVRIAHELLQKEVKVESVAIREIETEIKKIIEKCTSVKY
jgi:tetratricopeptide (TPR) repeat protein